MKRLIANEKKIKFFVISGFVTLFIFFFKFVPSSFKTFYLISLALAGFLSLIWALEIIADKKVWPFVLILPAHILVGAILTLFGFPNLSPIFSFILIVTFLCIYYATLLVLNIFVVAALREKGIPLYRAASTWSQILIVVISIPVFAGIFKLPLNPFVQVGFVVISSFSFLTFFLWSLELDASKNVNYFLALLCSFWVLLLALSILFLPFEALFRGLFLASALLFGLGYMQNYLKHALSSKIILEHIIITIAFLFLGLLFIP